MLGFHPSEHKALDGSVYRSGNDDAWLWWSGRSKKYQTRDAAMRAAEADFGLPVCEVVND